MEEQQTSGVEFAGEAGQQTIEVSQVDNTGVEVESEAGTQKGNPETAWEKRISSMRQKWDQEVSQKYGDYDQIRERATQFENHSKALERMARLEGFPDVNSYMEAIERTERQREIEAEAQRLGVDPSVIMDHLAPLRQQVNDLTTEKQKYEQLQQQLTLQQEVSATRQKYPDFDQYKQQIVDIVEQRGYRIEDAYLLASYQDKMSRITKETEANTIRNLQQNADSSPGALGADSPDTQSGYLSMSPAERKAFRDKVRNG